MPLKDFSTQLTTIEGQPLLDADMPATMGKVIANALLSNAPDDNADGATKAERYALALRIVHAKDIDVTHKEIVTMQEIVGKTCTTLAVGQVFAFLKE